MSSLTKINALLENTKTAIEGYTPIAHSPKEAIPHVDKLKQLFAQGQQTLAQLEADSLNLSPDQTKQLLSTATVIQKKVAENRNALEQAGIPAAAYIIALQNLLRLLESPSIKESLKRGKNVSPVENDNPL
jgi:hypothetical protein